MRVSQSCAVRSAEMYNPGPTRHNLLKHLRVLFKVLNCLGLTGVVYNSASRKFEYPRTRQKITRLIYESIFVFSGLLIVKCIVSYLLLYAGMLPLDVDRQSVAAQEYTISVFSSYIHTTSAFVYSLNYVRKRRTFPLLFDEGLKIFNMLQARTGPELFLSSKMAHVLLVKTALLMFSMRFMIVVSIIMLALYLVNVDYTMFPILSALMIFSFIYVQLTLLCFYEKMNEYFDTFGSSLTQRQLVRCLREFMSISRRIHRFQRQINSFASSVFMSTYFGLFHDIEFIYLTLKSVFYSKYFSDNESAQLDCVLYFPACFSFTFDMFIIALLSEMLESANEKFQTIVVRLSEEIRVPALHRDVEMMLLQESICRLGFWAFGRIEVDQQFSFQFMINTVLVFVITFLQFFAAEQIYTKNFKMLNVSNEFAVHL